VERLQSWVNTKQEINMNTNEVLELDDAELEVVAGGRMDCGQALGKFYRALSAGMAAIGNYDLAIRFEATPVTVANGNGMASVQALNRGLGSIATMQQKRGRQSYR
jgi:hypothetical protein